MPNEQQIATSYLNDFATKVKSCSDITEYYALIGGVFIFSELLQHHFKELYEFDEELDTEKILLELRIAAKIAADNIVSANVKRENKFN